jgi:hypothetical protein
MSTSVLPRLLVLPNAPAHHAGRGSAPPSPQ